MLACRHDLLTRSFLDFKCLPSYVDETSQGRDSELRRGLLGKRPGSQQESCGASADGEADDFDDPMTQTLVLVVVVVMVMVVEGVVSERPWFCPFCTVVLVGELNSPDLFRSGKGSLREGKGDARRVQPQGRQAPSEAGAE